MNNGLKACVLGVAFFLTGAEAHGTGGSVQYQGCREIVAQVNVPVEAARGVVPANYAIVGEETGTVQAAIRVVQCDSVKVGHKVRPTATTQVGIPVVSPDSTGMVNNYTLLFLTDNSALRNWTKDFGSDAYRDSHIGIQETVGIDGSLSAIATAGSFRGTSAKLIVTGPARFPIGPFSANWWDTTKLGRIRFATELPALSISSCSGTLEVNAGSKAAEFFGGTSVPLTVCFNNQFDSAVTSGGVVP